MIYIIPIFELGNTNDEHIFINFLKQFFMKAKFFYGLLVFATILWSCSEDDNFPDVDGEGPDVGAEIVSFTGIEFAYTTSAATTRVFSTSTGVLYQDGEIIDDVGSVVDLVSRSTLDEISFISPDEEDDITIPNATATKIQHNGVSVTAEQFDSMTNDSILKDLVITNDNGSIPGSDFSDKIILFENGRGKKGAIKIVALSFGGVQVDIKVIK